MRNTAVEMFATKIMAFDITPKQMLYFLDWYQLALEMEKQEIIKAYDTGAWEVHCRDASSEDYYKETYGKDG